MKGADVAMASIVQYNDWLEEEVMTSPARLSTFFIIEEKIIIIISCIYLSKNKCLIWTFCIETFALETKESLITNLKYFLPLFKTRFSPKDNFSINSKCVFEPTAQTDDTSK